MCIYNIIPTNNTGQLGSSCSKTASLSGTGHSLVRAPYSPWIGWIKRDWEIHQLNWWNFQPSLSTGKPILIQLECRSGMIMNQSSDIQGILESAKKAPASILQQASGSCHNLCTVCQTVNLSRL